MCGILGHLHPTQARELTVAALKHRGPDAHGTWRSLKGDVWLGHTRLAILDLSEAGSQPMQDPETGDVIVFNGEIYNHLELRAELQRLNVTFAGHSDTETILRGYGVWGPSVFRRLRGMFALAIHDTQQRCVVFARDRFGIKPLYLRFLRDGSLAFGSEIRPLLAIESATISRPGVSEYLMWGACAHDRLLFEGTSEFPAGCWAAVKPSQISIRAERFWPTEEVKVGPEFQPHSGSETRTGIPGRVHELLRDAVKSHLISDVPVACFLSGGIDSSILVALAAKEMGSRRLATFSVGFTENTFDESRFAQMMASHHVTDHHHITLSSSQKLDLVSDAVEAMDLPSADAINTYIVSNMAAQSGFKVALSGLGADEVFGGYPIFRHFGMFSCLAATPRILRTAIRATGKGVHLFSDVPEEKTGENLARWWRRIWNGDMLRRNGFAVPNPYASTSPQLRDAMAEISWSEITSYLRDSLLRDSDAMSMAHSLEIRVPFLDNALVDYVLKLPARYKFNPTIPKSLLLESTKGLIPEEIWKRPKMGFGLPMREWMLGPLRDFCRTGLEALQTWDVLNRQRSEALWGKFARDHVNASAMWSACVLGHYFNRSLRNSSVP